MKKINLLTGLAVASLFIFAATGCKKDNDSGGGAGVSATINGAGWQSQTLWTGGEHSGGTTTVFGGYSGVFYNGQLDDSVKIENGHFNVTYMEN